MSRWLVRFSGGIIVLALGQGLGCFSALAQSTNVSSSGAVTLTNTFTVASTGTTTFFKQSSGDLQFTGPIIGGASGATLYLNTSAADSLTTFTFSGSNSFAGRIQLNRGSLVVDNLNALGNVNNEVYLNSYVNNSVGNLRFNISGTFSNPINNFEAIYDNTIGVGTNNVTLTGNIYGGGGLTKYGTGRLTITGNNSYANGTTISAGTLQVGNGGTTGTLGSGSVVNSGTLEFNRAGSLTVGNAISGTGSLVQSGSGATTLSASSTFTGGTTINAGTLALGAANRLADTGAVAVNAGTFNLGGFSDTVGAVTLAGGTITSGTLTGSSYDMQSGTVSAVLAGSGALTKSTAGTVTLSGANTYSGGTFVNAGTLQINGGSPLASTNTWLGPWTIGSGATLRFITNLGYFNGTPSFNFTTNGGGTIDVATVVVTKGNSTFTSSGGARNQILGGTLNLNGNTATFDVARGTDPTADLVSSLSFNSSGPLIKTGNGIMVLSGNGFTGRALTVSGGTLVVSAPLNDPTIPGSYSGSISNNASFVMSNSAAQTVVGVISGTGELVQAGTGVTTLSGSNTYTGGTVINAGTLALGAANRLADSGAVTVNGGTFSLGGNSETVAAVTLAGGTITNGTLTGTSYDMRSGTVSAVLAGSAALTKSTAGTVTLSGANTYTGGTTINAGTLALGAANRLADSGAVTVNAGTFNLGGFSDTVGAVTLAGGTITNGTLTGSFYDMQSGTVSAVLAGSGALTKSTTNTVTLSGANTYTGGTLINEGTLRLNGGNLGTGNVTNNATLVSLGATLANNISGTGALVQDGSNITTLSGSNSFSGSATINDGTLRLNSSNALANASGLFFGASNTPTLELNSPVNGGIINVNGGLNGGTNARVRRGSVFNNSVELAVNVASNTTANFAGVISDSGLSVGFTKNGAGTQILSGANTYGGVTRINAGTLALGASERIWDNTGLFVNGGTFDLGGFSETVGYVMLSGGSIANGTLTNNGNLNGPYDVRSGTASAVLAGSAALTKDTTNTVVLSGNNTYTGGTWIIAGTLQIGNGGTSGTLGTGSVTNNSVLVIDRNNAYALSNVISGNGSLVQAGTGTTTLTANNSYAGGTTINAGTLALGSANRLADSGAVTVNAGTFNLGGFSETVAAVTLAGGAITNGTLTGSSYAMQSGNVSAVLAGSGALTKSTTNTVTLAGANTYTGGTTVNAGRLVTASSERLADGGTVTVNSGATLVLGGSETIASLSGAGSVQITGNLTTGTTNSTFSGAISGSGGLNKVGAGSFTLAGANTFQGDTILTGGTLVLASSNALWRGGVVTLNSGTTLTVNQRTFVGALDQLGGTINGAGELVSTLTKTDSGNLNAVIADGPDFAAGILKRTAGTTTVGAANTFTGMINLQGGTLQLGAGGSFAAASSLVLSPGGTMSLNSKSQAFSSVSGTGGTVALGSGALTVSGAENSSFGGAISGTGSLTKGGTADFELTGVSSYTGTTMVSGGTLIVAAGGSIASSSIATVGADAHLKVNGTAGAVSVSGTLSGSGTVGALTLSSGGTLAVGNSPGLLTASSANWNVGSAFQLEIVDALGTAGTDWDLFSVTGQLNLGGISASNKMLLTILSTDLQNYDVDTEYSWVFAQAASLAGTESWASGLDVTDRFAITSNGFNGGTQPGGGFAVVTGTSEGGLATLSIKAVPEPSSASLLVVGIGGLLALRRRRKS